jgi:hypothetical protein
MSTIVKTVTPVDSISGMLGSRDKFVSKKAFICNVSKAGSWKTKGSYMYLSLRSVSRNTPVSATETAQRIKFGQCVNDTRTRMRDPQQLAIDQANFAAQKKYPTLYGYVFSQVWNTL